MRPKSMIYFAPLEDISGYRFRNLFNSMFFGVDRYFGAFISAVEPGRKHKKRETEDVAPENNINIDLIPQILTNDPDAFLNTARWLTEKDYKEINLNLGCPARDVVSRGKGSGFLEYPDRLDAFFDRVFKGLEEMGEEGVRISVKSRTGRRSTENAGKLIEIFNRYPLSEVILHPRLGKDFYRGKPDMDIFNRFYAELKHPLVYNGDLLTCDDISGIEKSFPGLKAVMIGRGFLRNPALAREYKGGEPLDAAEIFGFIEKLYREYKENLNAEKYALDKMKELWGWLKDNPEFSGKERKVRAVLKAGSCDEYESAVRMVRLKE